MSQSKGSTVFCKLQLHALSKKTVPKISLNPRLNLTIFRGERMHWFNCVDKISIRAFPHSSGRGVKSQAMCKMI